MTATSRISRRRKTWMIVTVAVVLLLGITLVAGPGPKNGPPLDPTSTGPDGTAALVELLRAAGASVTIASGPPASTSASVLVLAANLTDDEERAFARWNRQGGSLVVADPASGLAAVAPSSAIPPAIVGRVDLRRKACSLPALRDVNSVDPAGGVVFHIPPGDTGCFPAERGAFVLSRAPDPLAPDAGSVWLVGGPGPFTNAALDHDDNSVLAVDLLGAGPGTDVTIAWPVAGGLGRGRKKLIDLVSRHVKLALWQLIIAFGVVILWRSRRPGRVAAEPQPVQIEASELVGAVGRLLEQGRRRDEAARLLRAELVRRVQARLGATDRGPDGALDAVSLAEMVASRTGLDPALVLRALEPRPVRNDHDLVALARAIDEIDAEVALAR